MMTPAVIVTLQIMTVIETLVVIQMFQIPIINQVTVTLVVI